MRIFLDANILFSAAKSDGAIKRLLTLLVEAGHECAVDTYVIEEAARNLAAKAPVRVAVLDELLSQFHIAGFQRSEQNFDPGVSLPEKDLPVFAAAVRSASSVLLTGDRTHFGSLFGRTFHGVTIHSPRSLAEVLFK